MRHQPGNLIGNYEVLFELGSGGMGQVYKARDLKLGREVAIKVLPQEMASDSQRLRRFEVEARAASALNHPNIITIYEIGEHKGTPYIAMEYVEGKTLREMLAGGPLPNDKLLRYATQMAEGLAKAHQAGIVHRDLKPENIVISEDGYVKILDFGLAKVSPEGVVGPEFSTLARETTPGAILGTVGYMSPEQAKGESADFRSDQFSLGAILYEMATGRRAFERDSAAQTLTAIIEDEPELVTLVNPKVAATTASVTNRCLSKDPNERYDSTADIARDIHGEELAMPPSTSQRHPVATVGIVGLLAIVLVMVFGLFVSDIREWVASGTDAPRIDSIAVLPLDNYSGDPSQEYFAEGMTDELTADLARISQLRVISRGSAMQFRGEHRLPPPEIAKLLDVDAVVEGSVLRAGDRVRITVQLIDARADRHLWANSFERSSRDILALQDELTSAIAREIHVQLTPAEQSRLGSAPTVNPEAYDAYLKGRYFFNRPSDENLQKAIARFEEAIAISPDFVPALSGLSDAYLWAGYNEGFLTASEARPKAKDAAEKAIELDGNSAEAHTSLAVFKLFYEYDWAGSELEFRRAFELNPNYAYAHDQFGLGLAFQGRFDESIAESRRAAELDPLNPQIPIDAMFAFAWQGDHPAAREQARRSAELDPTFFFPPFAYGWFDIQAGKVQEAIPHFEKAKSMGPPPFVSAWLAYAYGASGDRARALQELEEVKRMSLGGSVTAFNLALVSLGLGEHGRAVSYLEQAYASDSEWLGWLGRDRTFDPLRSDPRFLDLLRRMNFPE